MNPKAIAVWILGGGVGIAVLALAAQQWISVEVSRQLADKNIVPATTVTALDTRVTGLEELHDTDVTRVDKAIDRVDDKAERIATILMED